MPHLLDLPNELLIEIFALAYSTPLKNISDWPSHTKIYNAIKEVSLYYTRLSSVALDAFFQTFTLHVQHAYASGAPARFEQNLPLLDPDFPRHRIQRLHITIINWLSRTTPKQLAQSLRLPGLKSLHIDNQDWGPSEKSSVMAAGAAIVLDEWRSTEMGRGVEGLHDRGERGVLHPAT
jgi:hypothetical protein